jgi:hypothetical protein
MQGVSAGHVTCHYSKQFATSNVTFLFTTSSTVYEMISWRAVYCSAMKMLWWLQRNNRMVSKISGSHGGEEEDGCILGWCAMWYGRCLRTLQRRLLPPSSGRWPDYVASNIPEGNHLQEHSTLEVPLFLFHVVWLLTLLLSRMMTGWARVVWKGRNRTHVSWSSWTPTVEYLHEGLRAHSVPLPKHASRTICHS